MPPQGELSSAICGHWPVLPLRVLAIKRDRATWLVEAGTEPPNKVMQSGDSIVFIERYRDTRQKLGPHKKAKRALRPSEEPQHQQDRGRDHEKHSKTALNPFRTTTKDPLATEDPWATYKKPEGTNKTNTDPAVLGRLRRAEEAITRIEARQDQTDKSIQSMHSSMDSRFPGGFAGTCCPPRRATTQD